MSIKSWRPLALSTQKIITTLKRQADTAPILGSARVQPAYRLSDYLDRLIYVLRTWIPLVARLYSAPGCLALNRGLGVGSSQSKPTNVSGWEEPVGGPKRPLPRLVIRGGQGVPNGGLRQPGKALW